MNETKYIKAKIAKIENYLLHTKARVYNVY